MDCKTARLLLDFIRPGTPELEAAEADAVDGHLAHCPECDTLARQERRVDHVLGKAMRQVEVPDGLRARLLARLEAERGDWYRHRFGHGVRALLAVAAAVLVVWGLWWWYQPGRQAVDLEGFYGPATMAQLTREEVTNSFRRLGVEAPLPEDLNYAFLSSYGVTELPGHAGKKVPWLEFVDRQERRPRVGDRPERPNRVRVYIVSDREFDLKDLPQGPQLSLSGSEFKLTVVPRPVTPYAYLILHTGEDFDWLKPPRERDAI
jgi:hypothetical protein